MFSKTPTMAQLDRDFDVLFGSLCLPAIEPPTQLPPELKMNRNRRMTDKYPITQRLSLVWLNWRAVIRNDPALKENAMFALCGIVFLLGMWMGAR